jgi:hypothetical protein
MSRDQRCRRSKQPHGALLGLDRLRAAAELRGYVHGGFLRPAATPTATTAALSVGVGFLPVSGATAGLGPLATGAVLQ